MIGSDRAPAHVVHPDRELYRVHKVSHGPLFFSSTRQIGSGWRFDLPHDSGCGTCYFATSPLGAFIETLGRLRVIPEHEVTSRRLTTLVVTSQLHLADLTSREVLGRLNIAGDLSTGTDYRTSQEWAIRFWEQGFDGVFYAARHDPHFTERAVAVFGRQGDQSGDDKRFEFTTGELSQELIREVEAEFALCVVPSTPVLDDQ